MAQYPTKINKYKWKHDKRNLLVYDHDFY